MIEGLGLAKVRIAKSHVVRFVNVAEALEEENVEAKLREELNKRLVGIKLEYEIELGRQKLEEKGILEKLSE